MHTMKIIAGNPWLLICARFAAGVGSKFVIVAPVVFAAVVITGVAVVAAAYVVAVVVVGYYKRTKF